MKRIIYKENIPSTDPRLKRHVNHDSKSKEFAFNTAGIQLVNTTHIRRIAILDQGQVGSCTGNAGIGVIGTDPHQELSNTIYSLNETGALELYSAAETIDGDGPYPPNDNGSSGLSVAKALLAKGLISGYQHNFTLQDTLAALTQYPLMIGIPWYEGMFTPDPDGRLRITGALAGGHEVELDVLDCDNQRVWLPNSWGAAWGINGTAYLTWADLGTLLSQNGDSTVLFPATVTPPAPVTYIRILKVTSPMMHGDDVKDVQTILGITADGYYGPNTEQAVVAFQEKNGLVADGIVGPLTWAALTK